MLRAELDSQYDYANGNLLMMNYQQGALPFYTQNGKRRPDTAQIGRRSRG